ncbi:MAG: ATP-binding protein [Hyphomicrobiales bacterium]
MNVNVKDLSNKDGKDNLGWSDPTLDHIAELACSIFDVPVSFVSILTNHQPMFKSLKGACLSGIPAENSFCATALKGKEILVVEDTTKDPAFKNEPKLFEETQAVFYAGFPLVLQSGLELGVFCIIDSKPRAFSKDDREKLAKLGQICLATLENCSLRAQTLEYTTAWKRLNDAEDQTAHLGNMIERSSNEFYVVDGSTMKFRYINKRARDNLGYSHDEIIQMSPFDIKAKITKESLMEAVNQLRSGEKTQVQYDADHRRKNGEFYPIDIRLERDHIGTKEVFIAIGMDVTEKKQQEAEFLKLADLNQAIFDSSEAGILSMRAIYDAIGDIIDFRFVAANPTVGKILNSPPESIIGKTIQESFPQRIEQGIFNKYKQVVETGEPIFFEIYLQETNFNGWHRVAAVPTGKQGVTISFISIHKIKSTEIQLQKTNAELRQSNDILNQFNSIVAHDLKRPIRHMNLFAELLLEDINEPEKTTETAHKILSSAKQAQHMVRTLTEFASVGRHSLIFRTVSINKTIQTVKTQLRDKFDLSNTLSPISDHLSVKGDENLIVQLFTNLIENSIKYRSEETPLLSLQHHELDAMVYFQLSDNGIGIPSSQATNVFRMFHRLPNGLHERGDGVGLAICQRIVQSHGGKIWIDPDYQEGTRIHFSLPKVMPNDQVPEA